MGLTWKLCLVFMAFSMQLCYLKDKAPKAVKVPDYIPGISQLPDYQEGVTHDFEFTYSLSTVDTLHLFSPESDRYIALYLIN